MGTTGVATHTKTARSAACHGPAQAASANLPSIAIVGNPNVGKSVLFHLLTGVYVTVSNYPGTTVEISRGTSKLGGKEVVVIDTPGMYGLMPITAEERIARRILLDEQPDVVVHIVDAKNLERMLPMTLQLIEAGLPLVLVLNLMDEAERLGVQVDADALGGALGIPVVATALARGRGAEQVRQAIAAILRTSVERGAAAAQVSIDYPPYIGAAITSVARALRGKYRLSRWTMALLLLQGDDDIAALVGEREPEAKDAIQAVAAERARLAQPPELLVALALHHTTRRILSAVLVLPEETPNGFAEQLGAAMTRPLTGVPILLLTLYLVYQFVGVLGAQVLVDFLENTLFGAYINPWVDHWLAVLLPWEAVRQLIGGEYGIITLGVRYAFAIVLPVVGTFFLAFSVIEDSGYLPRLAMLIDRLFKKIGLSGRAVIPMVLGFGCDTMATIVARTLETRRERVISTLLLALAIPCSAQLGVMLGLMSGKPQLLAAWALIMAGVFLLVGYLAAQVTPGERPTFYMELPPLRYPTAKNVLVKTLARMEWYFREVLPLFVLASVIIWLGRLTGLFDVAINALMPVMRWLGLPDAAAPAFLFGFFRRDYGAAGLYDLRGVFSDGQLLVATVTMTLFIPCIAQLAVMVKERGAKTALGIVAFIFPFALLVGGLLHRLLGWLGVS